MDVEGAHDIGVKGHVVGRDPMAINAGEVNDGISPRQSTEDLPEINNVADDVARRGVIRRADTIEYGDLVRMRQQFGNDPFAQFPAPPVTMMFKF
jgi:hypothetical protein